MTDTPAAISFLKEWEPKGPWVLTAISLDRKSIQTTTFDLTTLGECTDWIELYNGTRNIYFHVNPTISPVDKKAQREDMLEMRWLHVDVDPREGKNLDEERDRAFTALMSPPGGIPKPTVIIFSGGGYQGFWRLEEPFAINGELGLAETAKRWNLQLELLFGGDNCHNVDRIMRLPGTINIPDAKKRKKGRTETLAKVEIFDHSRVYPLSMFTPAAPTQSLETFGHAAQTLNISGNIPRIGTMDELDEWQVPDRIKVIVVQGRHPDEPPKADDSRSSWLFDCVCNLVRCKVPDEVIFSLITDKDFGISASVLDKGSNIESYAKRQIGKAKEFVIDPMLSEMNERYAVIENFGGKCRVVEELMDPALNRSKLSALSFGDFKNAHMNRRIEVGVDKSGDPRFMPLGDWWLKHTERRQYKRVVFIPNQEVPDAYNLWRGFSCEARPGKWNLLHEHIRENICQGIDELYYYLMGWLARVVQRPGEAGQSAVVMRGEQGTGKSFLAKTLGSLLGRHYMQVGNASQLVGNFNSHLRDCVLLFADEAFYAGDKKHEGVLKMLVTEETMPIEAKGVDVETATNCLHLMMASNKEWVVPAHSRSERRFFVLDVGNKHIQDTTYFGAIQKQLDNGGREGLLYDLLNYDLSDFDVRNVPKTQALRDQQVESYSVEEEWWYSKLCEGWMLESRPENVPWPSIVLTSALYDDYLEYTKRNSFRSPKNRIHFGRFLAKVAGPKRANSPISAGMRKVYVFDSLDVCRVRWMEVYKQGEWVTEIPDETITAPMQPEEIF